MCNAWNVAPKLFAERATSDESAAAQFVGCEPCALGKNGDRRVTVYARAGDFKEPWLRQ